MNPPTLSRVLYEIFESDLEELSRPGSGAEHTIDREVRLDFSNGDVRYISWCSDPEQSCIGVQEKSFFNPGGSITRDMSSHPLWRELIGKAISLEFLDSAHQILQVRCDGSSTYLYSRDAGHWFSDVVTVGDIKPRVDSP